MQLDLRKYFAEACVVTIVWQLSAGISIYLWNPYVFAEVFPHLFYYKLVALELLIIALFSVVTFLTLRVFFSVVFFFSSKLSITFSLLIFALIVTIYIFSWMQFLIFGKFINLSSIDMFIASPIQMLMHAKDLVNLPLYRIVIVPASVLVVLYVFVKHVRGLLPRKILFFVFLSLNLAYALINIMRIDSTPYVTKMINVDRMVLSVADYMRYLEVSAASPFITLKESVMDRALSDYALEQREGVEFRDILPSDSVESLLHGQDFQDWDVIVMEIESLHPQTLSSINPNLRIRIMPTVDTIAAESQIFTNAYAQSSHSSYADLVPLSSQYPLRSMSTYIYPENIIYPKVMIYDVLSKLGYKTAIISSQNEEWQGMDNYLKSPGLDTFIHAGNYKKMLKRNGVAAHGINAYKVKKIGLDPLASFAGKLTDGTTVSIINSWLSGLNKDERYFLYTNLQNSHMPYYLPADRKPRFFKSKEEEEEVRQRLRVDKYIDKEKTRTLYHESLNGIDEEIKRLVDHLKYLGRWKNTMLVITADTSISIAGSILGNGRELFEEVLHVPLIIKVPGKQTTKDVRLMQHLDVTPTILGYMGLKRHPGFQGVDFSNMRNCNSYSFAVAHTPMAFQYSVISDDGMKLTIDAATKQVAMESLRGDIDITEDAAKKNNLLKILKTWIVGQISYYKNEKMMSSKYPPRYKFDTSPCN